MSITSGFNSLHWFSICQILIMPNRGMSVSLVLKCSFCKVKLVYYENHCHHCWRTWQARFGIRESHRRVRMIELSCLDLIISVHSLDRSYDYCWLPLTGISNLYHCNIPETEWNLKKSSCCNCFMIWWFFVVSYNETFF